MQIQAINSVNFGQIYLAKGNYTNKQKNIIEQIKAELRKPSEKFGNKTAEDFYKSNEDIDFVMEEDPKYCDAIYLTGQQGLKQIGVWVEDTYTYSDFFQIGTYDEKHPFKTDDIELGKKEARKNSMQGLLTMGLAILTGIVYFFGLALAAKHDAVKKLPESAKPLIENVDSLANKAKSELPDTTKILKFVK